MTNMLQQAYIDLECGQLRLENDLQTCDTLREVMLRALFVGTPQMLHFT